MRACSVVRFMPRIAAAPLGPAMRHSRLTQSAENVLALGFLQRGDFRGSQKATGASTRETGGRHRACGERGAL